MVLLSNLANRGVPLRGGSLFRRFPKTTPFERHLEFQQRQPEAPNFNRMVLVSTII